MMPTLRLLALCMAALAAIQVPSPQIIRSSTDVIQVDVVVTDRKGETVRGLTREDFEVTENGRTQQISAFEFVDVPSQIGVTATPEGSEDVATNVLPERRRVYVLALDTFNVSPPQSVAVRRQATQFVKDLIEAGDLAAVVLLGDQSRSQGFTSDKSLLIAAIEQFIGHKSRSATLAIASDAANKQAGQRSAEVAAEDSETGVKANQARLMFGAVGEICRSLGASAVSRRSVILFSEGIEMDLTDLIGEDKRPGAGGRGLVHESARYAGGVLDAWQQMVTSAQRANVALYTVEPRGNTTGNESIMEATVERDPISGRPLPPAYVGLMREAQRGQGTLRTFATETGGIAIVGTDDFKTGFRRIAQANSSYYLLGYRPESTAADGKYHKIAVSVRGKNLQVNARKGYYAMATDLARPRPTTLRKT